MLFIGLVTIFFPGGRAVAQSKKKQRVISINHYGYVADTVLYRDSTRFYYSGLRGSRFTPYGFSANYRFERIGYNIASSMYNVVMAKCLFESLDGPFIRNVSYDSVRIYPGFGNGVLTPGNYYTATYEDSLLTTYTEMYNTLPQSTNKYLMPGLADTGRKRLCRYINCVNSLPACDTNVQWYLVYDASGLLISDTQRQYDSEWIRQHSYDPQGRLALSETLYKSSDGTQFKTQKQYDYDIKGNIIRRMELALHDTSGPDTILTEQVAYDVQGRPVAITYGGIGFPPYDQFYHYNKQGDVDTLRRLDKQTNIVHMAAIFYNLYRNPDSAIFYQLGTPAAKLVTRTLYHYETYEVPGGGMSPDPGVPVYPGTPALPPDSSIVPKVAGALTIYSNPASGSFKIRWNEKQPVTPVYVNIYTSTGQLVRKIFIEKAAFENTINIQGLSSDVYYLDIRTYSGGQLYAGSLTVNQ